MTQQMCSTAHWCCLYSLMTVCVSALFCDVTHELSRMDNNTGSIKDLSYLALEVNKTCFLFVMREKTMFEAAKFCRSWGARLTSVDSFVDNILQISMKAEKNMSLNIQQHFWTGLIWNKNIKSWLWENGDDLTATVPVSLSSGWFFFTTACVTMNSKQFESQECDNNYPFICKLTLDDDCSKVKSQENETCAQRCVSYLTSHKRTYVVPTVQPFLDNSTPPSENTTTSTVPTPGNDTKKDSRGSEEEQNRSSTKSSENMVVYLLAGLVLALFLAVVGLLVEVIKTRRRLRMTQSSNKISLVDILMVGNSGYSQPDGRFPEADNNQSVSCNTRDSLLRQDGLPENLYTSTDDTLTEAALLGGRLGDGATPFNNYAHLHQDGDTQAQNIYGMESASSQAPRSPTYESYH